MKPQIKKKWLKALRSGEYEQGENVLVDDNDCFCCLGVLTDLYLREKRKGWEKYTGTDNRGFTIPGSDEPYYLTPEVMEWAGFNLHDPKLKAKPAGYLLRYKIAVLNDDYHFDFNQLANLIEKQF